MSMKVSDFDYKLPEELIAQNPIEKREYSKLLVMNILLLKDQGLLLPNNSLYFSLSIQLLTVKSIVSINTSSL